MGYEFVINVEKSRFVREKSKIPVTVRFEGGISTWSGLLDLALEAGVVMKPSNGWYSRVDEDGVIEDKKWRAKETDSSEFWLPVLKNNNFKKWITINYKISHGSIHDAEELPELDEDSV